MYAGILKMLVLQVSVYAGKRFADKTNTDAIPERKYLTVIMVKFTRLSQLLHGLIQSGHEILESSKKRRSSPK